MRTASIKAPAWIFACLLGLAAGLLPTAPPAEAEPAERRWDLLLNDFFAGRGEKQPMNIYARERDNQWVSAVGSSRIPKSNRYSYNRGFHWVDMSKAPITGGAVKGRITIHIVPDMWVPPTHETFAIQIDVDATVADGKMTGTYKVVEINTTAEAKAPFGTGGTLLGESKPFPQPPYPDQVTFQFRLYGALHGGKPDYGERFLVLSLGFDGRKMISASRGRLGQNRGALIPVGMAPFPVPPDATASFDGDSVTVKIVVPDETLDGEKATYAIEIQGRVMQQIVVGSFRAVATTPDGKSHVHPGCFNGEWNAGAASASVKADERPWHKPVDGFKPAAPGEHPRLLFRKADVAALRKKAETPEGKAILARLRRTLDGKQGDGMPAAFNPEVGPVSSDGGGEFEKSAPLGSFTIGHVAGYGLLYQITGDAKYAELGKRCFEKALEGYRDRDRRYSYKAPYGALRAGPSLGWMAVGYDLCHDGWDAATRERFGKSISEYKEPKFDLDALTRGTHSPTSNHYGMQVGGAALALMAVAGEPWADAKRIDTLLKVSEGSMVRCMTDGFGDGGFFAEGDGTGSMASLIVFLSALQGWRNAMGRDYFTVERPNARMLAIKWIYMTVVRDGRPDFWPIRGGYGHNVWARHGKSGTGQFAIGLGSVLDEQKPALLWYYNHFLLAADEKAGAPYDTVCVYPHLAVSAFVNWPVGLKERNPAEVLPLCTRDSIHGFYVWRNRWQDENDIVISAYQGTGPKGFVSPPSAESALKIVAFGKKFDWGKLDAVKATHWQPGPRGETSVLTTGGGVSLAVDFSKASGADAMLVITGAAEGQKVKLGNTELTFKFLTAGQEPAVRVEGTKVVVGKQTVSIKDGNLVLGP